MRTLICLIALPVLAWAQEEREEEAAKGPAKRALEHVKVEMKEKGVMTMEKIWAGFAFLAAGSTPEEGEYSGELNECIRAVLHSINGDWRENWYWSLGGLFLAEVHKRWPKDEYRERLDEMVKIIQKNQEPTGGWSHKKGFTYGKKIKDLAIISGLMVAALGNMKAAGIEVPDGVIQRALAYADEMSDGGGGMAYGTGNPVRDPGATRGAGFLIGLKLMGRRGGLYGTIASGVGSRVGGLERGHAFPPVHFFNSAVANYLAGSYGTFKSQWKAKLLGMQESDGGIWLKNHEGIDYERTRHGNNVMGTSTLAVILLLEKGNLFTSKGRSKKGGKRRRGGKGRGKRNPFGR